MTSGYGLKIPTRITFLLIRLILPVLVILAFSIPAELCFTQTSNPLSFVKANPQLAPLTPIPTSAAASEKLPEPVQTSPVIPVYGRKIRTESAAAVGREVRLRPNEESRYEPRNELARQPSLQIIETGRINSTGFTVPRSRGHDARLTEIYIDGVALQDPYSGLPLVDDLDLRTFGELRFFQGVAPYNIPTTQPVGVLQYHDTWSHRPGIMVGSELGRPYGWSLFGEAHGSADAGSTKTFSSFDPSASPQTAALSWSIFGRVHQTDGEFSYYNDNGTPFNDVDDRWQTRSNNFRASRTVIPKLEWRLGPGLLRGLAIFQGSHTGLPAPDDSYATGAAERGQLAMGLVSYRYDGAKPSREKSQSSIRQSSIRQSSIRQSSIRQSSIRQSSIRQSSIPTLPTQPTLETEFTYSYTHRSLENDSVPVSQGSGGTYQIAVDRLHLASSWSRGFDAKFDGILSQSRIIDRKVDILGEEIRNSKVRQNGLRLHLGLGTHYSSKLRLEVKLTGSRKSTTVDHQGLLDSVDTPQDLSKETNWLHGVNTSATYATKVGKVYGQWGSHERPPSILEEFGDGMRIRGNATLQPETYRHHEVGLLDRHARASWGVSLFHDEVSGKIAFLPSLLGTERAQNIRRVTLSGLDGHLVWQRRAFELTTAMAYIRALDLRSGAPDSPLVGVPQQRLTVTASYGFGDITGRLISRYEKCYLPRPSS